MKPDVPLDATLQSSVTTMLFCFFFYWQFALIYFCSSEYALRQMKIFLEVSLVDAFSNWKLPSWFYSFSCHANDEAVAAKT